MDQLFDLIEFAEIAILVISGIVIFYLIFKRISDKDKEKFEKRDN